MTTVQKWGNSLGIRIPKSIAEQAELSAGTEVEFDISDGALTIHRKKRRKYTLKELLSQAKGPNPYRYLDRDKPVGRELL